MRAIKSPSFCVYFQMLFLLNTGKHSSSFLYATSDIGKDVDDVVQMLKIRYVVGYGMTECGPLISYKGWSHPMIGNNGDIAAPTIEVRIDSEHPASIPGESRYVVQLLLKGIITILMQPRLHLQAMVG